MLEHETADLLAMNSVGLDRGGAGANQITGSLRASHPAPNTGVNSPPRRSLARLTASRRLVLTRSPGFLGINEGATAVQAYPEK